MARLPEPGSDIDTWGEVLNEYLLVSHTDDGFLKPNTVGTPQLQAGAVTTEKIADASVTLAKLDSGVIAALPKTKTRIAPFQFDHTGSFITQTSAVKLTLRQPFMMPASAKRFRIHTRNRNFLTDTDAKGTISNYQIWIGEHVISGAKGFTSAFKAAPVRVTGPVTITDGIEHISDWVDASVVKLDALKPMLMSRSLSVSAGSQISVGGGAQFIAFNDTVVSQTAAIATDITPNQNHLDTWIEYEYEDKGQPMMMVVSNSLSGPGNTNNYYQRGEISAWHQQWSLANNGIVATIAVAGSWAGHYTANSAKWNHYATASAPIVPDAVVFMGLSSSDVAGADGSAAAINSAKNSFGVAVEKARAVWPNARLIGTTNPPRSTTGAIETARITVNTWLATVPYGLEQCIDVDRVIRNPSTVSAIHAELDSGDKVHWNERGHSVVAQLIPIHGYRQ